MYSRVWHEKVALEAQSLHFSDVVGVMALKPASECGSFSSSRRCADSGSWRRGKKSNPKYLHGMWFDA